MGSIMMGKWVVACVAVVCSLQASTAQELKPAAHHAVMRVAASRETLDVSVVRLAAKAAFQPSVQPTQQELLSVIVLMSLREQRPST